MSALPAPLTDRDIKVVEWQAAICARSGMAGVESADEAAYVMLRALAVGFKVHQLVQAFEHFHVFTDGRGKRKVIVSAALLGSLARSHGCELRWYDTTRELATVGLRRPGSDYWAELTVTLEDARRAGLLGKDNWAKYPGPMLRAMAQRQIVRMEAQDYLLGLGPEVDVAADFEAEHDYGEEDGGDWVGPQETIPAPEIEHPGSRDAPAGGARAGEERRASVPSGGPAAPPGHDDQAVENVTRARLVEAINALPETGDRRRAHRDIVVRWGELEALDLAQLGEALAWVEGLGQR